jgi:hypothetical protein
VFPAMVVIGLGAGFSFVSITTAALGSIDDDSAGLASGLLSTSVQLGGALGVAAFVAAASQRSADLIASGSAPLAAQVGGLQLAFLLAAAVALGASLIAVFAMGGARDGTAAGSGAPEVAS